MLSPFDKPGSRQEDEFKDEAYKTIGAAIDVHNILGPGFPEAVYNEALRVEFDERDIPFEQNVELKIFYKERELAQTFRADFLIFNEVVVFIRNVGRLTREDMILMNQVLKATRLEKGILLNFGRSGKMEWRRITLNEHAGTPKPDNFGNRFD